MKLAMAVSCLGNLAALSAVSADDGELSPLTVVGGKDRALDLVGSAAYLDTGDIRNHGDANINRILAKVPGVYVREENGYGNFPNISIRGVDGGRSAKLTIMEDGVLMAPAAYSAPSAYYSPSAGRMSGLEVLKGSSQIKFGPHTTGGVINYLSTDIPAEQEFYTRMTYGSDNTLFNHIYFGDTVQTSHGAFGYLLEMHYHRSDGFRSVQGHGGLDTGFERIEPMVKLFWEPDSAVKQRFELKLGSTDFDANETYLGLSEADAASGSHDLYSAAQFDNIDTFHYRSYLKYIVEPTDDLKIEAAAYYNRFNRNWYKLNKIDGGNLDTALLDPAKVMALRGMTAGSVANVKANNRDYYSYGLQLAAQYDFDAGAVHHSVVGGVRYHTDRVRRFQWSDDYVSDGAGDFSFLEPHDAPGDDSNRRQQTDALALFVEDSIQVGKTTIRPGIRYEHLNVEYDEWAKSTAPVPFAKSSDSGSYGIWAGGIGFTHDLCDTDTLYGGVYRGVSVPGPRSHLKSDVEEESTLSYELGWRHRRDGFSIDLAGFYTDFSDLIARESIGGGTGADRNAGDVEVLGVELLASYDAAYNCPGFSLPMYVSATWTQSEFKTAIASGGEGGIWDGAVAGNQLPYVPEWKLAAGIGFATDQWGVNLDATYTGSQYGTGNNFSAPVTSSRQGKLDSFVLVDLSGYYQINDNWRVLAGVNNLFDEDYISSRVPHGPRNARGRHLYTGFELKF